MISSWQKIGSFIKEIHLETLLDQSGMPITVYLKNNRLQLVSNNAIYSYDDYYINFLYALKKLDLDKKKFHKVLVLGFGLGSIVYILEKKLKISAKYTAVELSEEVLYLAALYSLPRFISQVELIQTDASAFVFQNNEKFDLICIDVFQDDFIPANVRDPDFLSACKELLDPSGYLVFNQLYLNPKDKVESEKFTKEVFMPIFKGAESLYIAGNNMLLYQNPAN
jgi:spermidine synthase